MKLNTLTKSMLLSLVSVLFVWAPFWMRTSLAAREDGLNLGMARVLENYDGPYYQIISKTLYDQSKLEAFSVKLPATYFPAHLPLYPAIIALLDQVMIGTWAALVSVLLGNLVMVYFALKLAEYYKLESPLWYVLLILFLPARILAVRSTVSPEPIYLGLIMASIYYFLQQKYWTAGGFGMLAQMTKSPALTLFASFVVYVIYQRKWRWQYLWLLLMPLGGLMVFWIYRLQLHDFWAYFKSPDIPLSPLPFVGALKQGVWLTDFWTEDFIWLWLVGFVGVLMLWQKMKYRLPAIFATLYLVSTIFILHRDITRYALPVVPFVALAFQPYLVKSKAFRYALLLMLLPIYFYTWRFVSLNTIAIADWTPYL